MKWIRLVSFPLCVLLLLAAFGARFYFQKWSNISLGLLIASGVFFILSFILEWKEIAASFRQRSLKYGLSSSASILVVLAILVIINFMSFKHYKRFDMTESKKFSLSPQSVQLLKTLPRPVHMITFFAANQPLEQRKFNDLMHEILSHTTRIQLENFDLDKSPKQAQQYGVNIPGTIYLESGKQTAKITKVDEETIINAIHKVTKDTIKIIYFVEGHQEPSIDDSSNQGLSVFKDKLIKENYEVKKLRLASVAEIPSDASAVVLAAPTMDLLEHEINVLIKYAEEGGRLLLFMDPSASPTLLKITDKFGIRAENNIVVDTVQAYFGGNEFIPQVFSVPGSSVSETFSLNCFFPYTRSMGRLDNAPDDLNFNRTAQTTENSWGEFDKNVAQFDEGTDLKGPVTVGVSVDKKIDSSRELRIIAYGDVDYIKNAWFNILGNGNLALNSIAWLAEEKHLIAIKNKPDEGAPLPIDTFTSFLKNFMKFSQLILPGVIVLIGIIIWIKRRKL